MTRGSTSEPQGSSSGSPGTARRRNALVVASLVAAASALWSLARTQPADTAQLGLATGTGPSESLPEPTDPLDQIRTTDVMAPLSDDQPLRLALRGEFGQLQPGSRQRLFFATHRHFEGPIDAAAVERLLDAGRADTLEHRLTPESLEALREELADYDIALRDFALLIVDEESRAKQVLRERKDRNFEIRTKPREADAEYSLFLRERPVARDGTVFGEPLHPHGERLMVLLWSEWPALRQLYDDRTAMIVDRRRRVGRWIEERYRSEGRVIFQR